MNRLRRVVSSTVISLIGQAVTWTSTLLLTMAYGRFLGDIKFGELYFASSFVLLIGFPVEFGFNQQLTRDVAQEPGKALHHLSNALLIKVTLWFVLYGFILLLCWLLGYNAEERVLVAICGLTLLSGAVANTFAALHYAFERVVFPVVGTILEKGLSACIGFLLLKYGAGVQTMAFVLLVGALVNASWQAMWFMRLVGTSLIIDSRVLRELIRTSIPFLIYGGIGVIYYRIDTILLSLMESVTVVGWYGAAYRLFDTLIFLPNLIIIPIMFPIFSKLSVNSELALKGAIEKCMNFLLFFSIPVATGLIVAAPNIIGFLYHRSEFNHSISALQALAPGLVFLYINMLLGNVLVSTKREKKIPIMAGSALVFNLGLNLILIPTYRHVGAAIVTSLTELLLLFISIAFIPKYLWPLGSLRVGAKALMAGLVMAVAILLLHNYDILVILPIAALVYFSITILLRTIPKEDIRSLYREIKNKAQRNSSLSDDQQEIVHLPQKDIDLKSNDKTEIKSFIPESVELQ